MKKFATWVLITGICLLIISFSDRISNIKSTLNAILVLETKNNKLLELGVCD